MTALVTYLQQITTLVPDLTITTARLHTTDGQFNDIVVVNDDLVFRFPRTPEVARTYPVQTTLLRYLHTKLPLPIPVPLYTSPPTATWDQCTLGYQRLPGEPLYRTTLATMNDDTILQAIATQLATFLRALHQLPIADLPGPVPVYDRRADWEMFSHEVQSNLFPHMRPEARHAVAAHFATYLTYPARLAYQPTLRHGDFGGSNILYDRQRQRVSGIIDFESIGLGDPAVDIAALATYGDAFVARCLAIYPEIAQMMDRVHFYQGTFALQEAAAGLRDGDPDAFARGMATYR